jgi:hypothetical protein
MAPPLLKGSDWLLLPGAKRKTMMKETTRTGLMSLGVKRCDRVRRASRRGPLAQLLRKPVGVPRRARGYSLKRLYMTNTAKDSESLFSYRFQISRMSMLNYLIFPL